MGVGASGFTLLELLVATGLAALIVGFTLAYLGGQRAGLRYQEEMVDLQERARIALEMMVLDLRQAQGRRPGAKGGLLTALPTVVAFEVGTGADPADLDTLSSKLDRGILRRRVQNDGTSGFQQLVTNVRALAFTYYDAGGSVTTDEAMVRRVVIEVTTESAGYIPNSTRRETLTMRTAVALRNMIY